MDERFWQLLDRLVAESAIVIDRPQGSRHPRYPDAVYPLDYGYLEGTTQIDGDGIDIWCGSTGAGLVTAVIVTVDLRKRDTEIKVLLGCTPTEQDLVHGWHQAESQAALLVTRVSGER